MKRGIHPTLLVAMLSATLLGCSEGTTQQDPFALTRYTPTGHSPQPCVAFSLDAPAQTTRGAELNVTLTAQNICEQDVKLPLAYNVHHDLLVLDQSDAVLWQLAHQGDPRQTTIEYEMLSPDEKLTFEVTWPGTNNRGRVVPAGDYRLVGLLYSLDESNPEVFIPENQNFEAVQNLVLQP